MILFYETIEEAKQVAEAAGWNFHETKNGVNNRCSILTLTNSKGLYESTYLSYGLTDVVWRNALEFALLRQNHTLEYNSKSIGVMKPYLKDGNFTGLFTVNYFRMPQDSNNPPIIDPNPATIKKLVSLQNQYKYLTRFKSIVNEKEVEVLGIVECKGGGVKVVCSCIAETSASENNIAENYRRIVLREEKLDPAPKVGWKPEIYVRHRPDDQFYKIEASPMISGSNGLLTIELWVHTRELKTSSDPNIDGLIINNYSDGVVQKCYDIPRLSYDYKLHSNGMLKIDIKPLNLITFDAEGNTFQDSRISR